MFAVIGGDKRNIALAELLFRRGYSVRLFGFEDGGPELSLRCKNLQEAISNAKYVIGPTPCSLGGGALNAPYHSQPLFIEDLFNIMGKNRVFIAGFIKPEVNLLAQDYEIEIIDMLTFEEMLVLNAIPTAEGAIKIAIDETDFTLHSSNCMVIGYGRIGTVLSRMLCGMGAKVTAIVNTPHAAALALSAGHEAVHFSDMNKILRNADVIFNTVPHIILDETNLQKVRKNTLIIDLASAPNGVDGAVSRALGLKTLFASSLPGKVAPLTTAEYMLKTIEGLISHE